jgi:hypothetical protein
MDLNEMELPDRLPTRTWAAAKTPMVMENPPDVVETKKEEDAIKNISKLLSKPVSQMSEEEELRLAQAIAEKIDHVTGTGPYERHRSSSLPNLINDSSWKQTTRTLIPVTDGHQHQHQHHQHQHSNNSVSSNESETSPTKVSNFLRDMNRYRDSMSEPLLDNDETKNTHQDEDHVETSAALLLSTSQSKSSCCNIGSQFCCCSDRCLCKVLVRHLSQWTTGSLVCTLHAVGILFILFHFVLLFIYGQQDVNGQKHLQLLDMGRTAITVICYLTASAQIMWSFLVLVVVAKSITRWNVVQMWSFYLLSCLSFACVYRFCFMIDADGISLPQGWNINTAHQLMYDAKSSAAVVANKTSASLILQHNTTIIASELHVTVMTLYFSITTQTSVGYGDIVPISILSRGISTLHMFIGMVYGSMLVGLTIESDMSVLLSSRHHELSKQLKRLVAWRKQEDEKMYYKRNIAPIQDLSCCGQCWRTVIDQCVGCCCDYRGRCTCDFVRQCVRNSIVRRIRRFLRSSLLVFNLVVVLAVNIALTLRAQTMCRTQHDKEACQGLTNVDVSIAVCVHVVLLIILLSVSMKYVKRTEKVTVWFLCCSFIATCVLFGSMYTLVSLWDDNAFSHTSKYTSALQKRASRGNTLETELFFFGRGFFSFQFFSMTTMTTTGYGYIGPSSILAMSIVMCQELLSFLFATYVLGIGIQSVATAIEMKRNPEKYGLVNADVNLKANVAALLSSSSTTKDDGGGSGSVLEDLLMGETGGSIDSGGSSSWLSGSEEHLGGEQKAELEHHSWKGSETVHELQLRISTLEQALKEA